MYQSLQEFHLSFARVSLDSPKVMYIIWASLDFTYNIVNIIFKGIMQYIVEDGSHCSLVRCSSILETKWPNEIAQRSLEGRLLYVIRMHSEPIHKENIE